MAHSLREFRTPIARVRGGRLVHDRPQRAHGSQPQGWPTGTQRAVVAIEPRLSSVLFAAYATHGITRHTSSLRSPKHSGSSTPNCVRFKAPDADPRRYKTINKWQASESHRRGQTQDLAACSLPLASTSKLLVEGEEGDRRGNVGVNAGNWIRRRGKQCRTRKAHKEDLKHCPKSEKMPGRPARPIARPTRRALPAKIRLGVLLTGPITFWHAPCLFDAHNALLCRAAQPLEQWQRSCAGGVRAQVSQLPSIRLSTTTTGVEYGGERRRRRRLALQSSSPSLLGFVRPGRSAAARVPNVLPNGV